MTEPGQAWVLLWTREAERYFQRLQPKTRARILKALRTLVLNPHASPNVLPLHGELEGLHRYRLGDLRIVMRLNAAGREIRIVAIASRGDVY